MREREYVGAAAKLDGPDSVLRRLVATVVREGDNYFVTQLGYERPGGCPGNGMVLGEDK